jgi:hypothetical protein
MYCAYTDKAPPTNAKRREPGNIGEGISREATVNVEKKTSKMSVPLIGTHPKRALLYVLLSKEFGLRTSDHQV